MTLTDIAEQKAQHDENLRLYFECIAVENTLRYQLINAVPSEYLDSLRNVDTDMISDSIPTIIAFLQ